jgi:hypothetical protein
MTDVLNPCDVMWCVRSVCVAEWIRSRASGFMHQESEGPSSVPGTCVASQGLYYGVAKLVAA